MKKLTVSMKVPIGPEDGRARGQLYFSGWLPTGKGNGILCQDAGVTTCLWFDRRSVGWNSAVGHEDPTRAQTVGVDKLFVEAVVLDVSDELGDYIVDQSADVNCHGAIEDMDRRAGDLVDRILSAVKDRLNRFVAYVRAFHGQYWLIQIYDEQFTRSQALAAFDAVFQFDDGEKFMYRIGGPTFVTSAVTSSAGRRIRGDQWEELKNFVSGDRRISFCLELLAGAEELANNGSPRLAITEGVVAMENAIATFARACEGDVNPNWIRNDRIHRSSVSSEIKRAGTKGCLDYLLPLLFSKEDLPDEILKVCREGYDARINVVHNSARSVPRIHEFLHGIRKLCRILLRFSSAASSPELPTIEMDQRMTISITTRPEREYRVPEATNEDSD